MIRLSTTATRRNPLAILPLALALVLATSACEEDRREGEIEDAFWAFTDAVAQRDADTVWDLTAAPVKAFAEELHKELTEAGKLITLYFPEWQQESLRKKLALDRLGDSPTPKDLFLNLLDFGHLRAGPAVAEGLHHEPPVVDGDEATFRTAAGETFTFLREEDGAWRSLAHEDLPEHPLVQTLRSNIKTLKSNVERLKAIYASATDPKTPEGAFNQIRDAVKAAEGRVLLTLVDAPGRKVIERLRTELKALGDSPKKEVDATLLSIGLQEATQSELVASEARLLSELARRGLFTEIFGIAGESGVRLVRLHSQTEATVVTTDAESFDFALEEDGLWHLTDVDIALENTLLHPFNGS